MVRVPAVVVDAAWRAKEHGKGQEAVPNLLVLHGATLFAHPHRRFELNP